MFLEEQKNFSNKFGSMIRKCLNILVIAKFFSETILEVRSLTLESIKIADGNHTLNICVLY